MSTTVDFNIRNGDPEEKKYTPQDLENLHDSLLSVLSAESQKNGVLVYTKDAQDGNDLVDVMVVFMEKDSAMDGDSLQITMPSAFELLTNPEHTSAELGRGKIVAYDIYNQPIYVLLEKNDLNYYSHSGVKIASKANLITPPEKDTLPTVQDDGDVVHSSISPDGSPNNAIVNAIATGHLSYININKLGNVYRIYDQGEDCLRYYTSAGYEINCIEPKILGIKHDSGDYALNVDGSFTLNGETFSTPSVNLEKLKAANVVSDLEIGVYHYINEDSEFEFYTHAGVKMASFDIEHEKHLLNIYSDNLKVNEDGELISESKEIKHIADVKISDYDNIGGNSLGEKHRLYESDGETIYKDNDDRDIYVILDEYNKVKLVSKTGVLLKEENVAIPALTPEYIGRITKGGDYYKLPESTMTVFSVGSFVSQLPTAPAVMPAIEDALLREQLEEDDFRALLSTKNLSSNIDTLIGEFTEVDGTKYDLSLGNIIEQFVAKDNALNIKIGELQTANTSLATTQQGLNAKNTALTTKTTELENANIALSGKTTELQDLKIVHEGTTNALDVKTDELQKKVTELKAQTAINVTYSAKFVELKTGLNELKDDLDDSDWFAVPLAKVKALLAKIPVLPTIEATADSATMDGADTTTEDSAAESTNIEETIEIDDLNVVAAYFSGQDSETEMNVNCVSINIQRDTADNIVDPNNLYTEIANYGLRKNIKVYDQSSRNDQYMWEFYDADGAMTRRAPSGSEEWLYKYYEIGNTCVKDDAAQVVLTCANMYKGSGEDLFDKCSYYILLNEYGIQYGRSFDVYNNGSEKCVDPATGLDEICS